MSDVRTTTDLGLQQHVARLARRRLDALRSQGGEQVSVMLVDRRSREVLAQFEARLPYGPGGSSRIEVTIR